MSLQSSNLTSFPKFPELFPELRALIWWHTMPAQRVVELLETSIGTYVASHPVALRICQESRAEALRRYKLSFANGIVSGAVAPKAMFYDPFKDRDVLRHTAKIYFDFKSDVLLISKKTFDGFHHDMKSFLGTTTDVEKIRHLALEYGVAPVHQNSQRLIQALRNLQGVQRLFRVDVTEGRDRSALRLVVDEGPSSTDRQAQIAACMERVRLGHCSFHTGNVQ